MITQNKSYAGNIQIMDQHKLPLLVTNRPIWCPFIYNEKSLKWLLSWKMLPENIHY